MTAPAPSSGRVSLAKTGPAVARMAETPPPAPTGRADGLALILARNDFYRSNAERMLLVVVGQALLIAALIAVLVRLTEFTASRDYFFPVQNDNTLILERALGDPVFTDEQIRDWAAKAVTRTLTFGYYDHLLRLQNSRVYFTTRGWASFTQAMADAQILERINAVKDSGNNIAGKDQVLIARLHGGARPVIKQQGLMGDLYVWQVEMTVDAAYLQQNRETSTPWKVSLLIVRVPSMQSRDGIGIDQMIAVKATP